MCIFYTYMIALWAYAGAFKSTEIIDPTRTSCAIWEKDKMTPTLKIDCGLWTGCNTSAAAGDALYNAACTTDYATEWANIIGSSVAERAEADAAATITGANGAVYTPHGNPDCAICIDESIRRARPPLSSPSCGPRVSAPTAAAPSRTPSGSTCSPT